MFLTKNRVAIVVAAFVLLVSAQIGSVFLRNRSGPWPRNERMTFLKTLSRSREDQQLHDSLSILPGELPGYTGFPRPATSIVSCFSVVDETQLDRPLIAGGKLEFRVSCSHPEGKNGTSLFYVRAYGPAILTGDVEDNLDGSYSFSVRFFDVGVYQLEVVLSYSNHPDWSDFPIKIQPGFEGHLLAGFPRSVQVIQMDAKDSVVSIGEVPLCAMTDMLQTSYSSPLDTSRWIVSEKLRNSPYAVDSKVTSFREEEFASGQNGIGFRMDFAQTGCRLITQNETSTDSLLSKALQKSLLPKKLIHVVFIGDSNMDRQSELFRSFFEGATPVETTWILTNEGILARIDEIRQTLQKLKELDHNFFVIFNAGLHDIDQLCNADFSEKRVKLLKFLNTTEDGFSCLETYERVLPLLVDAVLDFPAHLHVWETTTAAWPKWGNFGLSWPTWAYQSLPSDPTFVEVFNQVAWGVLTERKVPIFDAYWMTLARPDHREPTYRTRPNIGRKLVHAGPEVYSALMRQWTMMILETINPEYGNYID